MFTPPMQHLSHRLLPLIGLILLASLTSGCATRVLMSSDRYEKPEEETTQFRSSDEISQRWYPDSNLKRAYLTAVNDSSNGKHPI